MARHKKDSSSEDNSPEVEVLPPEEEQADQEVSEEEEGFEDAFEDLPDPEDADGKIQLLNEELCELKDERNTLNEKFLRLAAEYDNFRKRTLREKDDLAKYAGSELMLKLLPVIDTVMRGVEFNDKAQDLEAVKEGLVKVQKIFLEVLEKEGLEFIDEKDIPFDINYHMAVFQEEREDVDDNTVLDVFEKGYRLKDKVLRPAKVKVSKKVESDSNEQRTQNSTDSEE